LEGIASTWMVSKSGVGVRRDFKDHADSQDLYSGLSDRQLVVFDISNFANIHLTVIRDYYNTYFFKCNNCEVE